MKKIFTSESVCSGHPDKVCDQISDAILDEVLRQDPYGRVAIESLACFNKLVIAGEMKTSAVVNFKQIARQQIKRLGYNHKRYNFSYTLPIDTYVHVQSGEIATGVDNDGAGDQGMMFGFACNHTETFMPLPITLAHELTRSMDRLRETNTLPYLRPDGKSQVSIGFEKEKPISVESVVLAVPHDEAVALDQVSTDLYTLAVAPVLKKYGFSIQKKNVVVNGTGIWHIGGPSMDTGLTGRKIIVDTYGGYARVGGGAFSGKDPTKVDRSGAYAARFIAKNIVANGLADKAEVRLAYCIGLKKPLMQEIETFGTARVSRKALNAFSDRLICTSVRQIIDRLSLRQPIYLKTASYGHFGQKEFPWEKIVKI